MLMSLRVYTSTLLSAQIEQLFEAVVTGQGVAVEVRRLFPADDLQLVEHVHVAARQPPGVPLLAIDGWLLAVERSNGLRKRAVLFQKVRQGFGAGLADAPKQRRRLACLDHHLAVVFLVSTGKAPLGHPFID